LTPDSRTTTPKNKQKNNGAATGSRKDKNTQATTAKSIFSPEVIFRFFLGGAGFMAISFLGTRSLTM
jgi:hypothetical protein